MIDDFTHNEQMTALAEQCEAIGLDFDLDAALASGMAVGDVAYLALFAAPSTDELSMIRAGELRRPRFDVSDQSHLHA